MIIEGTHAFPASRAAVWDMLLDPDVIAKATPGTRGMRRLAEGSYAGTMHLGVGPLVAAEMDVSITLADVVPLESYAMVIRCTGRLASLEGRATIRLAADAPGTVLHYAAEFQVGGAVVAVGHRLLESLGRIMAKQGLEALSRELERRLGAPAPAPPRGPPAPPDAHPA